MIGILVVVVLVIAVLVYKGLHGSTTAAATTRRVASQQVTIASVASLSPANAPLSIVGRVNSLNQATILSQAAGEITTLNVSMGDQVYAGETIAVLENSSQQAAVTQAEGSYASAQAVLAEAVGGSSGDQSAPAADQSSENAEIGAQTALQTAYADLDDAVNTKAGTLFYAPSSYQTTAPPTLNSILVNGVLAYSNNTEILATVASERQNLNTVLADANSLANGTTTVDVDTALDSMVADTQTVQTFLDNLSQIVTDTTPNTNTATTLSTFATTISAARAEVVSAVSALNSAKTTYDTTLNGSSVAEANVETALGALESAKSALAKTYITSPIAGTIVDLPVTAGDYLPTETEVAEVSNPGTLEIVTQVSAADAKTFSIGNTATINGTVTGTISQISPAIDPKTGTIEIDIALTGDQSSLTDGDSVTVEMNRTAASLLSSESASDTSASSTASIVVPIVALKITPTGPEVFTVDPQKHVLVAVPVSIGSILGEDIVVTDGLTPNLMIVTDARGLVAGESVTIKKQ
jgi:RND family efflux transporter MFP subunit